MSLPDLHRHLDGSLRASTVHELAAEIGLEVDLETLPFYAGMGLDEALARFAVTLSLLTDPDAVRRVADEMCEDAAAEGVSTLEIRFAPQLHGPVAEVFVEAALEGINGRAGLILCALYGEDPAVCSHLVDLGARHAGGVVGIDLAGGPSPGDRYRLEEYGAAFRRAADLGLGRTVHAGEGRPAREIQLAIELLHAQRVGHGTTLLDDPAVLALVLEREVVIEACPTSNVHTGVIGALREHPVARWLDAGVRVCINTDNTLFSAVTAPMELDRVRTIDGITESRIQTLVATGHEAAFGLF